MSKNELEKRTKNLEEKRGIGHDYYVLKIMLGEKTIFWLMLNDGSEKGRFIRKLTPEEAAAYK